MVYNSNFDFHYDTFIVNISRIPSNFFSKIRISFIALVPFCKKMALLFYMMKWILRFKKKSFWPHFKICFFLRFSVLCR